nr:hypothetical protein [Tanacetum cinerariifolium]
MGNTKIKFNPLKDIDDHVPIPSVYEKSFDSLDYVSETLKMTITNPLFDFDSKFTLNSDNLIFDIPNEESDEFDRETIMDEVQIHSSQSAAQFPPPYEELNFDVTKPNLILAFSRFCYGIFGSYRVFDILGPRLLFSISYGFGLIFPEIFIKIHSLYLFDSGDENEMVDYGLWEVIENGATFPKTQVVDGVITMMPIMNADEKQQRRLEVKIRSTLMKVIPNKHQLKFNSIKDAKQLLEAVERRFDRNTTTKKTQRNLLKQQFEKFFASSSEMLDQTFDRLQNNTNGVVNTAQAVNTANGVATARTQVNVVDNLSDAVICAFPASQPNSPQLAHENVEQIHPDDIEEIDLRCLLGLICLKWSATTATRGDTLLGSVELQEIKIPSTRRSVLVETPTSTALVSCDGLGGSIGVIRQKKDLTMHS